MKLYIADVSRCLNCDAPYSAERRLRRGRCPICYAYLRVHGTEHPLPDPKPAARKRLQSGRLRYGKSCPRCDAFIAMRSTHCPSCAQVVRHRGES